jgi:hypothetical protein
MQHACRGLNQVGLERLTYSEDFYYHHNHPCIQWLVTLAETVTNRAVGDGLKNFNRMVIITCCEGDKIWLKTMGIFHNICIANTNNFLWRRQDLKELNIRMLNNGISLKYYQAIGLQ